MMEFREGGPTPQELGEKSKKLTRAEVESRLEKNESLEYLDLKDLYLAGLKLEGKSFRGSDIRGTTLYRKEQRENGMVVEDEIRTDIKNSDWTDTTIADFGDGVFFGRVDAEGATFGYTENLASRRKRYEKSDKGPPAEDTGGLFGFDGSEGNFKRTKWVNVDFGGGSGYESIFPGADLSESIIEKSDLTEMDFSTTKIENIKIKDPISLHGLKINEQQISSIIQAIELTNQENKSEFLEEINKKGLMKALKDYFGIIIAEIKD